jgi:nucleotide-binding universal stress UspA family protein
MDRILVPIDGSEQAARALQFLVKRIGTGQRAEVHLVNVQVPIQLPIRLNAEPTLTKESIEQTQAAAGDQVLQPARALLDSNGVSYKSKVFIGDAALSIAQYAKEQGCGEIVMGTRGMGSIANLILGSVATKVIHLVDVPVTLVK